MNHLPTSPFCFQGSIDGVSGTPAKVWVFTLEKSFVVAIEGRAAIELARGAPLTTMSLVSAGCDVFTANATLHLLNACFEPLSTPLTGIENAHSGKPTQTEIANGYTTNKIGI